MRVGASRTAPEHQQSAPRPTALAPAAQSQPAPPGRTLPPRSVTNQGVPFARRSGGPFPRRLTRCWAVIGPAFGPCRPSRVTLAQISTFRRMVEANVSLREAHRCVKIWRALWRVAAALKYCQRDADPSLGVRNVEPKPRQAVWEHGEVVRLCKGAWG